MSELISIHEAAEKGVQYLRLPKWLNPLDHLKVDIINGKPGPWTHLYAPFNKECNGRDPVDLLTIHMNYDSKEWEQYTGPMHDSEEYKAQVAQYEGCLSERASQT